jgi:hypothetical protein
MKKTTQIWGKTDIRWESYKQNSETGYNSQYLRTADHATQNQSAIDHFRWILRVHLWTEGKQAEQTVSAWPPDGYFQCLGDPFGVFFSIFGLVSLVRMGKLEKEGF